MRGNLLRVDPGMERHTVEVALLSQKRHVEKKLVGATGENFTRWMEERDAIKTLLERLNEQ